jgi:DNA-binding XRE family transcriptional regulator
MGEVIPLPVRRQPPEQTHEPDAGAPAATPPVPRRDLPGVPAEPGVPVEPGLPVEPGVPEPLWRESVGHELRKQRLAAGKRLVDVAEEAGVSPQYLSEVERGLKDPSSELLAAMAGALGLSVAEIATRVAGGARRTGPPTPQSPVCLAA